MSHLHNVQRSKNKILECAVLLTVEKNTSTAQLKLLVGR